MHEGEARERHGELGAGLMRRAHAMPFGAEILPDGVRFALWSPTAREVALRRSTGASGQCRSTQKAGADWSCRRLGPARATHTGSTAACRAGPRLALSARRRAGAQRRRRSDAYGWTDGDWADALGRGRDLRAHVGTATPEGTYAALATGSRTCATSAITAIELMPLAEFPGAATGAMTASCPSRPTPPTARPTT